MTRRPKKNVRRRASSSSSMKGGFYLRGTNVRLRGITKRLDREFRRPREYVGKRGAAFRRRAIAVGNRVDAQLTKYVRTKSIKGLGAQAKALVSFLSQRDWTPVGAQVPVCNVKTRDATAIDLLCTDAAGAWVVVEVKTRCISMARHTEEYAKPNPERPKLAKYGCANSLFYRHQIQVAKTAAMFRRSKRCGGRTVHAVVLCIVDHTVLPYPLKRTFAGL